MSLLNYDTGTCRQCKLNGKCKEQTAISKALATISNQVTTEFEDDAIVCSVVLVCNRGGE